MTITRIVQTCRANPSQWEGFLADGRVFYIRYRHGNLSFYVDAINPLRFDCLSLFDDDLGRGNMDGDLSYAELRVELRARRIESPEALESQNLYHEGIVPFVDYQP